MAKRNNRGMKGPNCLEEIHESLSPRYWNPLTKHDNEIEKKLLAVLQSRWPIDLGASRRKRFLDEFENVLASLHTAKWSIPARSKVVTSILDHSEVRFESVAKWIRAHGIDEDEAVCDCIALEPPPQITILRRLPKTGSQKIIFEASWGLYQKTVILKKLLFPKHLVREQQSHPLNHQHPNIIKTYTLSNTSEHFLVEDKLNRVLKDSWEVEGTEQAALLIHDIASALAYLQSRGVVHGDVKPDNIGIDRGRFILLDFGVCRDASDNIDGRSATGSLRTRAPELLVSSKPQSIKSDVWALAATACCAITRTFPLLDQDERVPRVSTNDERKAFEKILQERVRDEYDIRLNARFSKMPDNRLRSLLQKMLARDPEQRPEPGEIVKEINQKLPHVIPNSETVGTLSISWTLEARSLAAMFPSADSMRRVPSIRRERLCNRIRELTGRLLETDPLRAHLDALTRSTGDAK